MDLYCLSCSDVVMWCFEGVGLMVSTVDTKLLHTSRLPTTKQIGIERQYQGEYY